MCTSVLRAQLRFAAGMTVPQNLMERVDALQRVEVMPEGCVVGSTATAWASTRKQRARALAVASC